ncbi:MAG: MATE family efflux transporter [Oscillospiraceae bacterium]|nr:MATE family efflux transporter [Oscillospiraceae bacterium]
MSQIQENKMGVMPVGRLLANMAIPMMISMLVQAFYNVVDSIFVAWLSEDALTAVSLAFPLQNLCIAVGSGTAVGMNAVLSRSLGEKNQDMVDRSANTGIFLFVCSAVVFALVGAFLSRPFFMAQTTDAAIVEYGTDYISVCLMFSFGIFGQFCFERILQSTGRTGLAMITQLIGAVINIILDPILIFGLFGLPALGVKGAAVATVTGQIAACIVALIFDLKMNPEVRIRLSMIRWDKEVGTEIYSVGLPSIVMQSIGSVMTFGLNKILIVFSTTATAVFGVYFKLQSFIFMPIFGLNNGMVPIISYNYGAAKPERVKKTVILTICTSMTIMALGTVLLETAPGFLLSLFDASEEMLQIGVPALRIIATHLFLAGFCIIAGSVCQAIGSPVYSLITSVCRQLVVLLPAAWLLAKSGVLTMVWFAFPIAELASLILSAFFLTKTMKKANASMADRLN